MASLLSPSPSLIMNERGGPVPPSGLLDRLARLDPALSLRWMPNFDASCWAVTWEWKPTDLRWARVQSGEIDRVMAFDIIGYLPPACSVDEAAPYLERSLKEFPREEVSRLRNSITNWNDVEIPRQQVAELITGTLDSVHQEAKAPKGLLVNAPAGRIGRKKR